jgi:hypothetical protein
MFESSSTLRVNSKCKFPHLPLHKFPLQKVTIQTLCLFLHCSHSYHSISKNTNEWRYNSMLPYTSSWPGGHALGQFYLCLFTGNNVFLCTEDINKEDVLKSLHRWQIVLARSVCSVLVIISCRIYFWNASRMYGHWISDGSRNVSDRSKHYAEKKRKFPPQHGGITIQAIDCDRKTSVSFPSVLHLQPPPSGYHSPLTGAVPPFITGYFLSWQVFFCPVLSFFIAKTTMGGRWEGHWMGNLCQWPISQGWKERVRVCVCVCVQYTG